MTNELNILQAAQALAAHASKRQAVVAANIANADTPGFKARDIAPFSKTYQQFTDELPLRATRAGHFGAVPRPAIFDSMIVKGAEASPNGNTVSLEQEMTKGVKLRQEYDLALGVFRKSMDILKLSLGR